MKKLAVLITVIMLAGCQSVPVVPKWPDIPKEMLTACPDLKTLDPANDKLSTLIDTVADNYREYYQCSDKINDWIIWYKGQQDLWKTIK